MSTWPRREAHAIYWKLHAKYLTNQREEANRLLGMLSDYTDSQIEKEITEPHYRRFLKIRENISNKQYGRLYGAGYDAPVLPYFVAPIEKSCQEKEFCKKLFSKDGVDKLSSTLEIPQGLSLLSEVELGNYGRLDLLGKVARTVFAIEVKVGKAPNSLVSQIDRYRLALELDMTLGMYDEVKAYVVAEQFTNYEAIELSRLAVNMIEHAGTIESLRLL